MSDSSPFHVREYEPGDELAILDGFNRVFAGVDPTFEPRTLEAWRWQYLANPAGTKIFLCFDEQGHVVSQYAGIPVPIRLEGGPAHFLQVVDSFTDSERCRGLRRPGPFIVTGYPFCDAFTGAPPESAPVVYGLPVRSAWRIGKRFLDYKIVRVQHKLVAPLERLRANGVGTGGVGTGAGTAGSASLELEELERFPESVGSLTARMAERSGAVTERTAARLNWRFAERPETDYRLAVVRSSAGAGAADAGEPLGLAVFRRAAFDGVEDEGLVADWAVAPGRADVRALLLDWLVSAASAADCSRLVALFPDTADDWVEFQRHGFRVEPSRYFFVGRHFPRKYTMSWLRKNWYYTLGDTDLV